jgi:hypothetical protein
MISFASNPKLVWTAAFFGVGLWPRRKFRANEIPNALAVYAANRKERTARMQLTNRDNTWLRFRTDTDWVYDFDAWQTELVGLENARHGDRAAVKAF